MFSPDGKLLFSAKDANTVGIYSFDAVYKSEGAKTLPVIESRTRYSNAKIVLLGESGTGKTALANRLIKDGYSETDSTHGMSAARINMLPDASGSGTDREVWLWDLAGQPDYRVVHQIFLGETAVALLVVNPQSDDPFLNAEDWLSGLKDALRDVSHDATKLLVFARVDRGTTTLSDKKIDRFVKHHGFAGYIFTSARTGENCEDGATNEFSPLKKLIADNIPWSSLPYIATDKLLRTLKDDIVRRANDPNGEAVIRLSELYQWLRRNMPNENFSEEDVKSAVRLLGNQNLVLPLTFGDLLLLRPAVMNSYASAVLRAARKHVDEIGIVKEEDVLLAKIDFEGVERQSKADEELLMRSLVELFLRRSLCLLESNGDTKYLVFPSQYRRDRDMENIPPLIVTFTFVGHLQIICAKLVVRVWLGASFDRKEIWQNAAEFKTPGGSAIGYTWSRSKNGQSQISVFSDPKVDQDTQAVFIRFIERHLASMATDVVRDRIFRCKSRTCNMPFLDAEAIRHRMTTSNRTIHCQYCGAKTLLNDPIEQKLLFAAPASKAADIESKAFDRLDNQAREQQLVGHMTAIAAEANQIYRSLQQFDYGIDGEIEFKDNLGRASGKKVYVQLKNGESYLRKRTSDGKTVFDVKDKRHIQYWQNQPCDVYLVVANGGGQIEWMNVSTYLRFRELKTSLQVEFVGVRLTAFAIMRLRDEVIPLASS